MKNITTFLPKAYAGMIKSQFSEAYTTYQRPLLCYCMCKVSSKALAEDLTQETFLKAWKYIMSGNNVENMRAFLYRILRNLIIDEYRRVGVHNDSLERLYEEGFEPGIDESDQLVDRIEGSKAIALLHEVRKPYRDVITLKYIKGFSTKEIAKINHISKNAVAVRIHRGLHMLKDNFLSKFSELSQSQK